MDSPRRLVKPYVDDLPNIFEMSSKLSPVDNRVNKDSEKYSPRGSPTNIKIKKISKD
jgi:hypothetical protein